MGREILYPAGGIEAGPDWRPIATAPLDGHAVTLGWIVGSRLHRERDSRWGYYHGVQGWDGGGAPSHWRPRS
jgi:hypothetical protein